MIVKNCAESLKKTLQSLRAQFLRPEDELLIVDTGCTDEGKTINVALDFGAKIVDGRYLRKDLRPYIEKWLPDYLDTFEKSDLASGCILDFAEARELGTQVAKNDIQFWIDADDILKEARPGSLRATTQKCFSEGAADEIFLEYLYAFDVHDKALTTTLKRERVFDRRKFKWVGRCHETLIPREGAEIKGGAWFSDLQSAIVHIKEREKAGPNYSDIRNYCIIRREIEETDKPDPRSVFYLGNAARGLARDVESLELYKRFLPTSGSKEDRFAAAYYIGMIYLNERARRPIDALEWGFLCVKLKPEDPRGPFLLSRAYFQQMRFNEALHWFRVGRLLPEPTNSLHSYDPSHIHALPFQIAAIAAKELDDEQLTIQLVQELTQNRPDHPDTKLLQQSVWNWIAGRKLMESIRRVIANSGGKTPDDALNNGRQLLEFLQQVPPELEDMGLAKLEPPDNREGKDLVIYCGKAPEAWGPRSGEAGIGGSEKAVIHMAARMQKRGFRVTVYTNVPAEQRGDDPNTGVRWLHYAQFDKARARGTIVFWRSPGMLEFPVSAKKRVLWCHDVQNQREYTLPRIALADHVLVLSEFHATTLGGARAALGNKLVVTRNGIDTSLFKKYFGQVQRDNKKIIYASSPDRGVLTAIRLYQGAKQRAPEEMKDASLHVFYGFNKMFLEQAAKFEYRGVPDVNRDISAYDYMQMVLQAVDQDDSIRWHGRVGWDELAREFCSGGVFLYPTRFPEISCMAAMEAQAAGLVPCCTNMGALKETVFINAERPIELDKPAETAQDLIRAVSGTSDELRELIHAQACERFDYDALADEWASLLSY